MSHRLFFGFSLTPHRHVHRMVLLTFREGCPLTTLKQLYDLQELDMELDRAGVQIVTLTKRIQDDAAVSSARQALAQRRESIQQMRRQQARRTQDIRDLQTKANDQEARLYGGSIHSVKEMEALQSEVKGLRDQARIIENDEVLTLMLQLEEAEPAEVRESAALQRLEQERSALLEQWTSERSKLEAAMPMLRSKRQEIASACTPVLLAQYEGLRRVKQGQAVAKMEHGTCMGCRVTLPVRELQRVRNATNPVLCPICGRMLYAG